MTKKQCVLGINAFGHDGAAALVDLHTGAVLHAVAEERLSNVKHDWRFPVGAALRCRDLAGEMGYRLHSMALGFDPAKFIDGTLKNEIDRILAGADTAKALFDHIMSVFPFGDYYCLRGYSFSASAIRPRLEELGLTEAQRSEVEERLTWYYNWAVKYAHLANMARALFPGLPVTPVGHHEAHAASAFYNSGFEEATVLIIDGQGESDTVSLYHGRDGSLSLVAKTFWPHSLGIFYLFCTNRLGFEQGDEYKVMGMAAYGSPVHYDLLRQAFEVTGEPGLRLRETDWFGLTRADDAGHIRFDFKPAFDAVIPRRDRGGAIGQAHFDFAASVQKLTEELGVEIARKAIETTGATRLALAGGVCLNGLMNEQIRLRSGCSDIFVMPAAADDGTAVGAAQVLAARQGRIAPGRLRSAYFGRDVGREEMREVLDRYGVAYSEPECIHETIAQALADKAIVARCVGRAEYGPRALGHRSIYANPSDAAMKDVVNTRIKHREPFRPFAPAVLEEVAGDYFEIDAPSPFMLLICRAREAARQKAPAVVHADGTARVQTVNAADHPDIHAVISRFAGKTGLPVIMNTSFNVNGETIVDSALDALESFGFMDIDYLALGPYWIAKAENRQRFGQPTHEEHLAKRRERYRREVDSPLIYQDTERFPACFFLE